MAVLSSRLAKISVGCPLMLSENGPFPRGEHHPRRLTSIFLEFGVSFPRARSFHLIFALINRLNKVRNFSFTCSTLD